MLFYYFSDDTESAVKKFVDKELKPLQVWCAVVYLLMVTIKSSFKDILNITKGCMSSKLVHFEKPRELIDELAELSDSVYTHKAEAFSLEAFRMRLELQLVLQRIEKSTTSRSE